MLLAAGDTFRAAAREQLAVWGERNNVAVIQQAGGDAAAVMFDAVGAAKARGIDVRARRHRRAPADAGSPDGGAAQGQARARARRSPARRTRCCSCSTPTPARTRSRRSRRSTRAVGLTGLVVTKLDGSAKGGVVAAIAKQHPVPLKFIGVGEGRRRPAPVRGARVRRRAAAGRDLTGLDARARARLERSSGSAGSRRIRRSVAVLRSASQAAVPPDPAC